MSRRPRKPMPLPAARWPTAAEAASARLFSPLALGPLEVEQRTWVPAMVPWRANEQGEVTPDNHSWYGRFAAGRPGVLVAEATGIRDIPSGPLLRISHERFVPGLHDLVRTVREQSEGHTRFFIQVIDFLTVRRRPEPRKFFDRYLELESRHREALSTWHNDPRWLEAPAADVRSALLEAGEDAWTASLNERELRALQYGYREEVNDTSLPHIAALPKILPGLFADAAERAREAGFDGLELHYAHAYTMASFLSRTNRRTDGYGGGLEERARLPLEVLEAVRERVGQDWCVGLRFLGDEVIAGGSGLEEATAFGVQFARAGADFLSVSKGGKFDDARQPRVGHAVYPYTGPSGDECMPTVRIDERGPFGRNVHLAATIRQAVREAGFETPVVTAGGICTFDQAEQILQRAQADLIGSARQALADPDWFLKIRLGQGQQIRRCLFTNYCEGLDQVHKQVTCQLWDKRVEAHEGDVPRSTDGRRRLSAPPWTP